MIVMDSKSQLTVDIIPGLLLKTKQFQCSQPRHIGFIFIAEIGIYDMFDGIVIGHVKWIVAAHDDFVRAVLSHQILKLVIAEHDAVYPDFAQIAGGWLWKVGLAILARTPCVINSSGVGRQIAAAVNRQNLQIWHVAQQSVEDNVMQCCCRFQWIANDVRKNNNHGSALLQ